MASLGNTIRAVLGIDTKKFTQGLKDAQGKVKSFGGGLKSVVATGAALAIGRQLLRAAKDATMLAAKGEDVRAAFNRLDDPQLLGRLRKATQNTVSDIELMTNAIRARNFKLPLEQLPKYFEFATRRARETGESVNYLVDSIVLGISRKSPKILDNLGLSLTEINEEFKRTGDYAAAVGNIAERELANMGKASDSAGVQIEQLSTAWKNLAEEIGQTFTEGGVGDAAGLFAEWLRIRRDPRLTGAQKRAMRKYGMVAGSGIYDAYLESLDDLKTKYSGVKGFNPLDAFYGSMGMGHFNMMDTLTPAVPKQIITIASLTEEIDLLEQKLSELDITNKTEIQSTLAEIKAKKDLIDQVRGETVAVKERTRAIMDAQQVWGEMVMPTMTGQQKGSTWGALEDSFADPTQLAAVSEQLVTQNDYLYEQLAIVQQLQGTFEGLFAAGLQGWDAFKEAAVEAILQMIVKLAALGATYAALAMIPGFAGFMEFVGAISNSMNVASKLNSGASAGVGSAVDAIGGLNLRTEIAGSNLAVIVSRGSSQIGSDT